MSDFGPGAGGQTPGTRCSA